MITKNSLNLKRFQLAIKYGGDFLLALLLVIPLSLCILGLGIILYVDSPGPIFFKQLRPGRNGKLFHLYKLRTMVPGDHTLETPRNPDGSLALTSDLKGFTRFGKWLRRFSLDEVPQIFNILLGQMSFIGPRPDLPEHMALYTLEDKQKLSVRPGMTGLAQIADRNELPWGERLKLDVKYIREYSLWLDLKIIAGTIGRVLSGRGVYSIKKAN